MNELKCSIKLNNKHNCLVDKRKLKNQKKSHSWNAELMFPYQSSSVRNHPNGSVFRREQKQKKTQFVCTRECSFVSLRNEHSTVFKANDAYFVLFSMFVRITTTKIGNTHKCFFLSFFRAFGIRTIIATKREQKKWTNTKLEFNYAVISNAKTTTVVYVRSSARVRG